MITCDKCGFGHKTFEEKRACKSWPELRAEALAGTVEDSPDPQERKAALDELVRLASANTESAN